MTDKKSPESFWGVALWLFGDADRADRLARELRSPEDIIRELAESRAHRAEWREERERREARKAARSLFSKHIVQTFVGVGFLVTMANAIYQLGIYLQWWT